MDLLKIVSMIRSSEVSDIVEDGKEKILFGVDDKRMGHVDAYGNVKDITNAPTLKRQSRGESQEYTLTLNTDEENPLIVKFIRCHANADLPTDVDINYMDPFPNRTLFLVGSHSSNNPVSEISISSQSRSSFNLKFNDGSAGELFDVIAVGE